MNNFKWFALFVSLLFSACASDSSVSSAEKNEEPATSSNEMISSSSISYGIIPIDTSSAQKGSDAGIFEFCFGKLGGIPLRESIKISNSVHKRLDSAERRVGQDAVSQVHHMRTIL